MLVRTITVSAAIIAFAALLACPVRADDSRAGVDTLKGLHGVRVVVEDLDSDLIAAGISGDHIQSNVEDQLKKAGITVEDEDAWKDDSAHPFLYIRLSSFKSDDGKFYAYHIDVELDQQVTVQNGDTRTLCQTWQTGCIGIAPKDSVPQLYDRVTTYVGEFVDDFNSQNPSSSARNEKSLPQKATKVASR